MADENDKPQDDKPPQPDIPKVMIATDILLRAMKEAVAAGCLPRTITASMTAITVTVCRDVFKFSLETTQEIIKDLWMTTPERKTFLS